MAIGIDFGTTNSALAWVDDQGTSQVARFTLNGDLIRTFRSILYYPLECEWVRGVPQAWSGPRAIEEYLDNDGEGRLMQSMKTFLASRIVKSTNVFGYDYQLEHLIAKLVRGLWDASHGQLGLSAPPALIAGRPVSFARADGPEDDAYAEARLRGAFKAAGFDEVEFVYEPVAAALHYEATLERDETVLVADFGGGTSDFCLLHVGPSHRANVRDPARILGTRGVGVAGDNLDMRIVQHLVAPVLGAGSLYKTMLGEQREIPPGVFEKLRRWNELSFLKTPKNMEMLLGYAKTGVEPERIKALIHLVDNNLGYRLYRAVEAAKVAISQAPEAELVFRDGPIDIRARLTRTDFDRWITPELDALGTCVDALLGDAKVAPEAIDTIFLTGGTAQVPAVRKLFADRFGEAKLATGDFLTSIASGLALYAGR